MKSGHPSLEPRILHRRHSGDVWRHRDERIHACQSRPRSRLVQPATGLIERIPFYFSLTLVSCSSPRDWPLPTQIRARPASGPA